MFVPILSVENVSMRFGGLTAVNNFSMQMGEDDLVGIIGPNGAGKTTLFNMITGHYKPTRGEIFLAKKCLNKLAPAYIVQKGIARTFQNIRLFQGLSVLDNIRLGLHFRVQYGWWAAILRSRSFHREEERMCEEAMGLLKIFGLEDKAGQLASNLCYGDQRRLEIARALATRPKLLLLDEPAAGMNPKETADLAKLIQWIKKQFKVAILLIEHDMQLVMKICQRIYVVNYGELIAHGTPDEIQKNPKVIAAYLGDEE